MHGGSTPPGPTPAGEPSIGAALEAVELAQEEEAVRTRRERRLSALLREADTLLNELELLNLREVHDVPGWLRLRLEQLENAVHWNTDPAPRPKTVAEALDRVYRHEEELCRLRQPWWFDFHQPERDAP